MAVRTRVVRARTYRCSPSRAGPDDDELDPSRTGLENDDINPARAGPGGVFLARAEPAVSLLIAENISAIELPRGNESQMRNTQLLELQKRFESPWPCEKTIARRRMMTMILKMTTIMATMNDDGDDE